MNHARCLPSVRASRPAIGADPARRRAALALALATALVIGLLPSSAWPVEAAATFVVDRVTDQADPDVTDGRCDVSFADGAQCTLRAAIQQANATVGADTIAFAIPGDGVKTIRPATPLPAVTRPATIDGYTQPGTSPNTAAIGTNAVLRIVLDGSAIADPGANGLTLRAANTVVRGLVVNRFPSDGVQVEETATGARVVGCFLGTDAAGTAGLGNIDEGVDVFGRDVLIGGSAPAARNLIADNGDDGIDLNSGAAGARVLGNLIGTDRTGAGNLGNGEDGIDTTRSDVLIGGSTAAEANTIAFSGADGVLVIGPETARNRILRNAIFANAEEGIDLGQDDGPTANDPTDADGGANGLQNKPVIAKATSGRVRGSLHSAPNASFAIRVFSSPSGDEGKVFRGGPFPVTTDGSGNATFDVPTGSPIPAGHAVTATATGAGGTSEFSAAVSVPA